MCAATVAVVAAVGAAGYSAYSQQQQQGGGGGGGFTEKPLKGFAPTKGLQSYTARLLAENATATRPTLQEFAESGGTAKFPIKDTGFSPEEAAQLGMVDPHTGMPVPFVERGQSRLTPAQQVFLGQQRYREGGRGPIAQFGHETMLETRAREAIDQPGVGVATSGRLAARIGRIQKRQEKASKQLRTGG